MLGFYVMEFTTDMNINPTAVVFWVFCALVGYLINDARGAAMGGVISIAFSFVLSFIDD